MSNKSNEIKGAKKLSGEEEFKGYTLDELRYQRALLLIKREFLRDKAIEESKKIKDKIPLINGNSGLGEITTKGVIGKVIRGLDFADYLLLGFQAIRIGKKFGSMFKRKK